MFGFRTISLQVLITLTSLLAAQGTGWLLLSRNLLFRNGLLSLVWMLLLSATVAALLGWLASLSPSRCLRRLVCICQAWLRGDLSARLFITERTIKAHVSNLLNKLSLSDRTQAAVYAWREGLMKKDP